MILSAGMGAGHDRVAAELSGRLDRRGVETQAVDVWDLLPMGLGRLITAFYKAVIRRAPLVYELIYAIWLRPVGRSGRRTSPVVRLAGRRLQQRIEVDQPDMILSTFHLCSQVLGDLRRRGQMPVPTASMVVDFATHGLWIDPDVDIHYFLHPTQAERAGRLGARETVVCGPAVGAQFPEAMARRRAGRPAARRSIGVDGPQPVALIVAGSWGAGRVEDTARIISRETDYQVVVVAGRNHRLRTRLESLGVARVFGWVDDMAGLMAAADVLVENAGGLTAMEAMAAGLPVVSFRPIPGHGRENVIRMHEAGLSAYACDETALLDALDRLAGDESFRRRLTSTAAAMFRSDPADHIAAMVTTPVGEEVVPA